MLNYISYNVKEKQIKNEIRINENLIIAHTLNVKCYLNQKWCEKKEIVQ